MEIQKIAFIEPELEIHSSSYDEDFINNEYLPKLKILTECLKNGTFPRKEE